MKTKKDLLRLKARELQAYVDRQTKDGKKYKLYSPWGYRLQLAEVELNGTFLMTHPIRKFKTDITEENLTFIENELKKFFKEGEAEIIKETK